MTAEKYLTADEVHKLLCLAYVRTDEGELWTLAQAHRWVVAAGLRRAADGQPVVGTGRLYDAFPELQSVAKAPRRGPHRPKYLGADKLPRVITVADLILATNWPSWRIRRRLKRLGIIEKRGREYVTTVEKLSEAIPEFVQALTAYRASKRRVTRSDT